MNPNNLERENQTGKNLEGAHPNESGRLLTASTVIGDRVENPKGEDMGKIKDIMLDLASGKIEYVVIEFGGFLGIGEKLFAVPFAALKLDSKKEVFVLDKDKKFLEKAPGFNKNHWPETNVHFGEVSGYWADFMGPNVGG